MGRTGGSVNASGEIRNESVNVAAGGSEPVATSESE
jgi:hypothetical protein